MHRCLGEPVLLDVVRTAYFVRRLSELDLIRCIGVDGMIAPLLEEAVEAEGLVGWEDLKLCYETEDEGRGWYRAHHHHMHVASW